MRLSAIAAAAILMGAATPAGAGDVGHWRGAYHRDAHRHHHGYHHHGLVHGPPYGAPVVIASEPPLYREPYLPRGVLYNAPPLPVYSGYAEHVVRARY